MAAYLSSSRYTSSSYDSGTSSVPISVRKPSYSPRFYNYMAKEGDSFESLAITMFGDPTRWWEIADINAHVPFPDTIEAGTTVRVPSR